MTKIDMNKRYRTRDGRPVRVLAVDLAGDHTVAAAITESGGDEWVEVFTADGRTFADASGAHHRDLIEVRSAEDVIADAVRAQWDEGVITAPSKVGAAIAAALREAGLLREGGE